MQIIHRFGSSFDAIQHREAPTTPIQSINQCDQSYFRQLEFEPAQIGCLALDEMIAEKIRACYQRDKARDIYDLGVFATRPLNQPRIRRLVVLKLWQAKDAFHPDRLIAKFADGRDFDWADLNQLVHRDQRIDKDTICNQCATGYGFLAQLGDDERKLASDPFGRENALHEALRVSLPKL